MSVYGPIYRSAPRRLAFAEVLKAGSTSIRDTLRNHGYGREIHPEALVRATHRPKVVGVIRHPETRLLSAWGTAIRLGRVEPSFTYAEFVQWLEDRNPKGDHWRPCSEWPCVSEWIPFEHLPTLFEELTGLELLHRRRSTYFADPIPLSPALLARYAKDIEIHAAALARHGTPKHE